MTEIELTEASPTAAEYIALRARIGWGMIDEETAHATIAGACYSACLRRNGELVGLVRLIGDGVLYFAFSDVMIASELRGSGHGARLMQAATNYLRRNARPGASISLQPLKGREPFYEKFGFARCPSGPFGAGMVFADAPPSIGGSFS